MLPPLKGLGFGLRGNFYFCRDLGTFEPRRESEDVFFDFDMLLWSLILKQRPLFRRYDGGDYRDWHLMVFRLRAEEHI
jgi:hypothetical protein